MAGFLSARENHVELITTFPHYPGWRFTDGTAARTSTTVEDDGVVVRRLRHRLPKRGSSVSRVLSEMSFGMRALLTRWHRPDVVVLVSPAMFSSALLVPRLLLQRTPFVVWVQDLYGLGIRETGNGRLTRLGGLVGRLEAWMLRRAPAVVVIGARMAEAVQEVGVRPERLSIVRNWTRIDPVRLDDPSTVRAEYGWSEDEAIVLHTGNMGVKQDLRNVVAAARLADASQRPVRFVLVGDGMDRQNVEAAAIGVDRLQLLPSLAPDDFDRVLQAADVLLVNEHPDVRGMALPSKLTSYFAAGRPVLAASDAQSATSAELRVSRAGDRVDPGDPEALLLGALRLVADQEHAQALAEAGLQYRGSVLQEEVAIRAFQRVLDGVTAAGVSRRTPPAAPSSRVPITAEITLRRS